jgi:hypothetical protein
MIRRLIGLAALVAVFVPVGAATQVNGSGGWYWYHPLPRGQIATVVYYFGRRDPNSIVLNSDRPDVVGLMGYGPGNPWLSTGQTPLISRNCEEITQAYSALLRPGEHTWRCVG